jgi:hypothetical protein
MKTYIKQIILLMVMLLYAASCAKIYTSPEFSSARSEHKTVAVLPFEVTIDAKKLPKHMTLETLKELEKDEGFTFQSQMYSRFLENQKKNKYTVQFQDVDRTNSILLRNGVSYENMRIHTKDELAEMLGVDAVVSGHIHRARPMSTGGAIASSLLLGYSGATNRVDMDVAIHSEQTGDLLWKYNHQASGGIGSSSEQLSKSLMKKISRKFPYNNA